MIVSWPQKDQPGPSPKKGHRGDLWAQPRSPQKEKGRRRPPLPITVSRSESFDLAGRLVVCETRFASPFERNLVTKLVEQLVHNPGTEYLGSKLDAKPIPGRLFQLLRRRKRLDVVSHFAPT